MADPFLWLLGVGVDKLEHQSITGWQELSDHLAHPRPWKLLSLT